MFIDPNTNLIAAKSTYKIDLDDPEHTYHNPSPAGTWEVNYIGVDINGRITSTRNFDPPHRLYPELLTIIPHGNASLDFYGNGIGVTFGEPITIPNGTFDSGIEKYLPKEEVPEYEPMDLSRVPAEMPEFIFTSGSSKSSSVPKSLPSSPRAAQEIINLITPDTI